MLCYVNSIHYQGIGFHSPGSIQFQAGHSDHRCYAWVNRWFVFNVSTSARCSCFQLFTFTGSYEAYVRAILHPACLSVEEGGLGYRAVVVNFRGCERLLVLSQGFLFTMFMNKSGAGVPLTTQQLYSAGHTDDFRQALAYITYLYPTAPLLGLGFSLGANVLTRYVAEEGDRSRLSSACALACVRLMIITGLLTYADPSVSPALGSGRK